MFNLLKCFHFPSTIFNVKLLKLFCITKLYLICQIFIIYVCIIQFRLLLFPFITFIIWSRCVFNAGECCWIICICKLQDLIHSDARTKLCFYSQTALLSLNLEILFLSVCSFKQSILKDWKPIIYINNFLVLTIRRYWKQCSDSCRNQSARKLMTAIRKPGLPKLC